ncbi:hypothetical protein D9M68_641180 [compost metagenome]
MSTGKKISARKVKRFIVGSLVLITFSCVLFAATKKQADRKIEGVKVTLQNQGEEENFLLEKDVEKLFVTNTNINILNKSISDLDLNHIEELAEQNPWVKSAEVYVDNNSKLNIEVTQRLLVARLFTREGRSFYIDSAGFEMPLSERYAYPVTVFTNVPHAANDSVYAGMKKRIVYMSEVLKADSFWNSQITQLDVVNEHHFNAYTTIGKQKIIIGDTARVADKLKNLYSFYREVSNKIGWNKYEVLDIRYRNQVVASPTFGWVPPKDTNTVAITEPVAAPAAHTNEVKPVVKTEPAKAVPVKAAAKPIVDAAVKKPAPEKPKVAKPLTKPSVKTTTSKPKYEYTNEKNKPNNKK